MADRARPLGRPRRVEDEDVFAAMGVVLLRVGLSRLSVQLIADELAITPAALRQRFGGKAELLTAFHQRGTEQIRTGLVAALAEDGREPLTVLRSVVRASVAQIEEPDHVMNALSVFTGGGGDPRLRLLIAERLELGITHTATLLERAITEGSLAGIRARALAEHLQRCIVGTCLIWSTGQARQPLCDELDALLDLVLAPYLRTTSQ
ncbi:TetR/AcrR family transcriptional regulator [Pseudonocardia spinosispora]|uniref:TetR/AcrR family transcriptional regulator n=1 Tax=Pseudonocardia spinosispora TaxID=103441 RepID=UPI00041F5B14|nr:TetR family transcriptional regulator [Pseudonocardia spinosispora]